MAKSKEPTIASLIKKLDVIDKRDKVQFSQAMKFMKHHDEVDTALGSLKGHIVTVESSLNSRTKLFEEIMSGLTAMSSTLSEHIREESEEFKIIHKKIDDIVVKVDAVNSIKVNGSVGLNEVLLNLYKLTQEKRIRYRLINDFKEWKQSNSVARIVLGTKVGTIIFVVFNVFILFAVLHAFGAPVDPLDLIFKAFGIISKIF